VIRTCVVLVASLLLSRCGGSSDEQIKPPTASLPSSDSGLIRFASDSPQLQRIKVEAVKTARVPLEEVVAPGTIQAIPTRVARVSMPAPGRVKRVLVGLGDSVRSGQTLLTVESPEAGSAISNFQQTDARIQQAKAAVAKAEADLTRTRDLLEHRAIAQKEVVSAESALAQASSDFSQANSARQEAQRRLLILGIIDNSPEIPVRAPVSGKVLEVSVAAGEYRNDTSAPVMTVADLTTVYVAADVPETLIRLIKAGETIEVRLVAYPGDAFKARVTRIADTVNAESRTIRVMAELPNPAGRLRPDMFGEIRHEETFQTVPVVPQGSVVQRQNATVVWRERSPGVFEPVSITAGKVQNGLVPVTSGLNAGDRVVIDGVMLLQTGLQ
jgi:membrane fusion protein, heavy metal efflux system